MLVMTIAITKTAIKTITPIILSMGKTFAVMGALMIVAGTPRAS